jgi:glycerol-3-phosphate dehydrogenase
VPDADIRVTVEDLATGETQTVEIKDDYVILAAGSCYVDHVQAYGTGTHILTVKGRKGA